MRQSVFGEPTPPPPPNPRQKMCEDITHLIFGAKALGMNETAEALYLALTAAINNALNSDKGQQK